MTQSRPSARHRLSESLMRMPGVSVIWGKRRWWQTLLFWLFLPAMLLASLYVLLFFFLNSTYFAEVLSSQLNGRFRGHFEFKHIAFSPAFDRLTIRGVVLQDPQREDVVRADVVQVSFEPIDLVKRLVNQNRLELDDIQVDGADVFLDFSRPGSFNLSEVFLPAEESPPQPPEPSTFSLGLNNVDIRDSEVFLDFGAFTVDLDDVRVRRFTLGIDPELRMATPPLRANDVAGLSASRARLVFKPAMFGFPMGLYGPADEGLILGETGGGSGGTLRRSMVRGAAASISPLIERVRERGDPRATAVLEQLLANASLPLPEQMRGTLPLEMEDVRIDGFWWSGTRYGFDRFLVHVLEGPERVGELFLGASMMDLTPPDRIDFSVEDFHLRVPGGGDLLAYFIGPALQSDADLVLDMDMAGDLGHAVGSISLRFDQFAFNDLEVADLSLDADLDGQFLELHQLSLKTLDAPVFVTGWMRILDGDMEVDATLGAPNPREGLRQGLDISSLLPPDQREMLGGRVSTRVFARQQGPELAVQLRAPVYFDLVNPLPYSGARSIRITQGSIPIEEARARLGPLPHAPELEVQRPAPPR